MGVKFVCGMWEMFLISELLWEVESGRKRWDPPPLLEWRAPSWSWAGGNHPLSGYQYQFDHLRCDRKQEMAEVTSKDVTALPSGQLVHASLVLRGRPVQAKVRMEDFVWWDDSIATMGYEHGKSLLDSESLVFDSLPLFPYEEELTFIALMRCHCKNDPEIAREPGLRGPEPSIAALMLRRLPTTPATYSRVGVLRLRGYEPCEFYNENQPVDEEDIVIV
ncbi:hypothetical protein N0V95_005127 [Ascochyta clinopodiicola]|nr:hypothetical protein N0V95_005127 [Ascochyta clinopodiicola]